MSKNHTTSHRNGSNYKQIFFLTVLLHTKLETNNERNCYIQPKKPKSFQSHKGPLGGADLRFCSPQPDTSRSCKSTDTGLVCRVECLFSSQLAPVSICCLVNRGTCVNNLPKVEREALRPGIKPATSRLQVRRPNHYATTPHWTNIQTKAKLLPVTTADINILNLLVGRFVKKFWTNSHDNLRTGTRNL